MKLSDLILLGSTLKPQCFGVTYDGRGTCAWGAAFDAMGVKLDVSKGDDYLSKQEMHNLWPIDDVNSSCPHCNEITSIGLIVTHLNDDHQWTRPQIAAWVAEQEVKLGIVEDEQWRNACKYIQDYPDAEQMIPDKKEDTKEVHNAPA